MNSQTQLIINDVVLPVTTGDRYQSFSVDLKVQKEMISGRLVEEVRGTVQKIVYSYDYMGDELGRAVLEVLRSRGSKTVSYLPDDGDELVTSTFLVESLTPPSLIFYEGGIPVWHNISFVLREVNPHA